ncbi:endolytic transglycosylase MltG [Oceanobacillus jordanicus]|uniref:endolytic transglycosylase MltG n=1 Tax=Oceanobacillus jordanicus TaxID=2867266 RepID=UPI001EDF0E42|nr:endolytic transglycosylase MltG [Oceanobacillus jordanicus]
MKQSVRSFAIGLFTAGILLLGGIFFFGTGGEKVEDLAAEDLIDLVEQKGYYVLNKEEYIAASVGDESKTASAETNSKEEDASKDKEDEATENAEAKEENSDENDSEKAEKEEEKEKTSYKLKIKEGMASSDISSVLENNDIIDDAGEFNEYLIDNDYHLKVQIGEYELTTGMSHYEVAEAITK